MNTATATTTPQPITDEEKARRRRARAYLKEEVKKASGLRATMICMAISHTRGKLHCRTYKLYDGGWRAGDYTKKKLQKLREDETFDWSHYDKYMSKFGPGLEEAERRNYANAVIQDLTDQADFLVKFLDEDDKRAAKLPEYKEAGRTIYSWMEPRFEPKLRMIMRQITDSVKVS